MLVENNVLKPQTVTVSERNVILNNTKQENISVILQWQLKHYRHISSIRDHLVRHRLNFETFNDIVKHFTVDRSYFMCYSCSLTTINSNETK